MRKRNKERVGRVGTCCVLGSVASERVIIIRVGSCEGNEGFVVESGGTSNSSGWVRQFDSVGSKLEPDMGLLWS